MKIALNSQTPWEGPRTHFENAALAYFRLFVPFDHIIKLGPFTDSTFQLTKILVSTWILQIGTEWPVRVPPICLLCYNIPIALKITFLSYNSTVFQAHLVSSRSPGSFSGRIS